MDYQALVLNSMAKLGVPQDDSWETIKASAIQRIGRDRVALWEVAPAEERTRLVLEDADSAITLGLGYRRASLELEVPWILEQVRKVHQPEDGPIIDIGSGTGFTAALLSEVTGTEILATEVSTELLPTMSEVAARLGATIKPTVSTLESLQELASSHNASQIVCQKVMGFLEVPHVHNPGFSWVDAVQRQFGSSETSGTAIEAEIRWHDDQTSDVSAELMRLELPVESQKFISYHPGDDVTLRFEVIDDGGVGVIYGTASNGDRFLRTFRFGTADAEGYVLDFFSFPEQGIYVEPVQSFD